jgi:monoamine oxidase
MVVLEPKVSLRDQGVGVQVERGRLQRQRREGMVVLEKKFSVRSMPVVVVEASVTVVHNMGRVVTVVVEMEVVQPPRMEHPIQVVVVVVVVVVVARMVLVVQVVPGS